MKTTRRTLLGAATAVTLAGPRRASAEPVQIEYWQYFFKERVAAMDELIHRFQDANPGITVRQSSFPYAQYRTKVGAAVPAGEGPDVFQLYYGWLRDYRRAGLLQALPTDLFPPATIDRDFFPFVQQMRVDGAYWAIPTAVRSLGLFTNRKLVTGAPPATLDAFLADAQSVAKRDESGNIVVEGTTIGLPSQDSHWWREVLVRQFGGRPFSDDYRHATYGDAAGADALRWYTDLQLKHHVALVGFMSEGQAAFRAGRVGLHVNGSFLVGPLQAARGLSWTVSELPQRNGVRANYASYWVNALAVGRGGARREAAQKFLAFITTDEAMQLWLEKTGELPAKPTAAKKLEGDAVYGGLVRGLDYAVATDFVDEDAQRQVFIDMLDRVLLKGQDPLASVREAAAAEQRIIDDYYAKG